MKQLAIAFALLVAACGGKSSSTTTPEGGGEGTGDAPTETAEVVTLTGVTMGDAACYIDFTRADGTEDSKPGSFDLCGDGDTHPLAGQQVTLRTEPGEVLAASCEGDPECPDTETVDLVVEITAAP